MKTSGNTSKINTMGKILKYKSLTLILLFTMSCSGDFLNKEPIIGNVEENFYQTPEDAIAAVNAAYAALQFELTPAGHFRWFWGDIMSDDSNKGGEGDNDQFDLKRLEEFQGPTDTEYLQAEWEADYEGIYRANKVLEKVPAIAMDDKLKARILGEARFIRAWFYYNLTALFGNVPLIDHVLAASEYSTPQAKPDELWNFIEADLMAAAQSLPKRSEYGPSDMGRVTQGAAYALLAKTYAFRNKWPQAKEALENIVKTGEYTLESDFGVIFTEAGENGKESVFEIQYMNASGGNWGRNNANEGTFSNVFQRARGQFEGYGFNIPTQSLVDEFFKEGQEDPRLKYTVFRVGDAMGDRGIFTLDATGGQTHQYYNKKAFNNKAEEAPFGDPNPNGGTNDRIIRYSDVLLLLAEASYFTGNESDARKYLNQVRTRVGLSSNSATGSGLLDAIYHERRMELAMEGHRYFDLIRTGRANALLGPLGFKTGVNEYLPIPNFEIIKSNGVYKQNPGY